MEIKEICEIIEKILSGKELKKENIDLILKDLPPLKAAILLKYLFRLSEKAQIDGKEEEIKMLAEAIEPKDLEKAFSIFEKEINKFDKFFYEIKKIKEEEYKYWREFFPRRYLEYKIKDLTNFILEFESANIDLYSDIKNIPYSIRKEIGQKIKNFRDMGLSENFIKKFIKMHEFTYRRENVHLLDPIIDKLKNNPKSLDNFEVKDLRNLIDIFNVMQQSGLGQKFLDLLEKFAEKNVGGMWLDLIKDRLEEYREGAERPIKEVLDELLDEEVIYKVLLSDAKRELFLDNYLLSGFSNINFMPGIPSVDPETKTIYLPASIGEFKILRGKDLRMNPNFTLYAGNNFHEIAHLRYGSYVGLNLEHYIKNFEDPTLARFLINIIEDFRVNYQFYKEFIQKRPAIVNALKSTNRYYLSKMNLSDDPLENFIKEFTAKLIGGKSLSQFNPKIKDKEEDFIKTPVFNENLKKRGIENYGDAIEYCVKIGKEVADKTVVHSAEKAKEVYDIIKELFEEKVKNQQGKDIIKKLSEQTSFFTDYNTEGKISEDLKKKVSEKDINRLLEELKKELGKEIGEVVDKISQEYKKEIEKNIEESIKRKTSPVYLPPYERDIEKKLKELRKKITEKALKDFREGKDLKIIEEELKKEFEEEIDKTDIMPWTSRWIKEDFSRETLDEVYQKFSKEKIDSVEKDLEKEIKNSEIAEKVLEKFKELKDKYEGKLIPKNLRELQELEREVEKRTKLQKDIIEKETIKFKTHRSEKELEEKKVRRSYFLGYDTSTDTYSRHQTAIFFPYIDENLSYWENMDKTEVVKTKNILQKLLKEKKKIKKNLKEGELDIEAAINAQIRLVSKDIDEESLQKIFQKAQKTERDYASAILLDVSESTKDPATTKNKKIIDVEKEAAYVLGEAASMLGDKLAIYGFDGSTPGEARIYEIKKFQDSWSSHVKAKLGSLSPKNDTPLSIAIRGVTSELNKRKEKNKLLFVITDGQPNCGSNIEDTRKALEEARKRGIYTVYINIDYSGGEKYYLEIADAASFAILLKDISQLPQQLFGIYLRKRKI